MVLVSVYAADMDNDGDMDVLSAAAVDDKVAWYENGVNNVTPTITGVSLAADNASIAVTMSEAVYSRNGGSGNLEATDFSLSISGGNATLASARHPVFPLTAMSTHWLSVYLPIWPTEPRPLR